jgi:hypothetical protein
MRLKHQLPRQNDRYFPAVVASLALIALSLRATPSNRVHLSTKFTPGEILRYQIESSTTANNKMETPIENPEAASKSRQNVSLILRINVLNPPSGHGEPPGSVRLRATYEKSSATFESDAYDPAGSTLQDQYKNLEGRSLEYTVELDGTLSHLSGIDDLLSNPVVAENVRSWMNGLSSSVRVPKGGVEIGQKWSNEQPIKGTPLGGLIWRNQSAYLRDEPCYPSDVPPKPSASDQAAPTVGTNAANASCAVIVTQFKIIRRGDATPDDYASKKLDTSGTWTGSGGSLESISLADGTLIRSTQNATQDMDVTIQSTRSGSKIHYVGHVVSRSEISLLPAETPSAALQP